MLVLPVTIIGWLLHFDGESLIWSTPKSNVTGVPQTLFLSKKYFTRSSFPDGRKVRQCSTDNLYYLAFDNFVFINNKPDQTIKLVHRVPLCCTTAQAD